MLLAIQEAQTQRSYRVIGFALKSNEKDSPGAGAKAERVEKGRQTKAVGIGLCTLRINPLPVPLRFAGK